MNADEADPLATVKEDMETLPVSKEGSPFYSMFYGSPLSFSFDMKPSKTDYEQKGAAAAMFKQIKGAATKAEWDSGTYQMTTTLTDGRVVKVALVIEQEEAKK